jgi:hypothetical protein
MIHYRWLIFDIDILKTFLSWINPFIRMKLTKIDRRSFLQYSAVLSGSAIFAPVLGNGHAGKKVDKMKSFWYNQPLRILQTVLREPDASSYDANAVVAYMEKSRCNTL